MSILCLGLAAEVTRVCLSSESSEMIGSTITMWLKFLWDFVLENYIFFILNPEKRDQKFKIGKIL